MAVEELLVQPRRMSEKLSVCKDKQKRDLPERRHARPALLLCQQLGYLLLQHRKVRHQDTPDKCIVYVVVSVDNLVAKVHHGTGIRKLNRRISALKNCSLPPRLFPTPVLPPGAASCSFCTLQNPVFSQVVVDTVNGCKNVCQ
jgi:hypothetical protein